MAPECGTLVDMTIPPPPAVFLNITARPLAALRSSGPVQVPPNTWTPIPWTTAPVDTHGGFEPAEPTAWRAPMTGLHQGGVTVEFAYRYRFAGWFAVLVDGVRTAEFVSLQQGWHEEDEFDDEKPPPLIHATAPYAAAFGAKAGQRVELAVRHMAPEALTFTGVNGGPVEGSIQWLK